MARLVKWWDHWLPPQQYRACACVGRTCDTAVLSTVGVNVDTTGVNADENVNGSAVSTPLYRTSNVAEVATATAGAPVMHTRDVVVDSSGTTVQALPPTVNDALLARPVPVMVI